MQGLHLTADLQGCECDVSLLTKEENLVALCQQAVEASGLSAVEQKFFTFPDWEGQPGGVTGAVLLAESHLALHTWPEIGGVTLDVYVCNFTTDNSGKAQYLIDQLVDAFKPKLQENNQILRASKDMDNQTGDLLLEWMNENSAYGYRATRRLETIQTEYQLLDVYEDPQWGNLFRLDGVYMTSENDEFFYHEPMIHIASMTHEAPRSALVIGGGDGGSAEELFKYPTMERVKMVEIDGEVVRVAKQYLQSIHKGAFDDPRMDLEITDGLKYVAEQSSNPEGDRFDIVILDLTDPDTPAFELYSKKFLAQIKDMLNPGGAMMMHIGPPAFKPKRVQEISGWLREVFKIVRPLGVYVPLYGAYWGMACASDTLDPRAIDSETVEQRIAERNIGDLQYYNGDTHHGLLALPNYFRELVK